MSFSERMKNAEAFEMLVLERLKNTGWQAFRFGQAQLPEECRHRLTRFEDGSRRPSLIRWMPDIITFRDFPNGKSWVALIDAKHCGDRPNLALEMSAIETAEIYTDQLFTPTFFVFNSWIVLTPREARQRGRVGPPPSDGRGSGTPYLLINKVYTRVFDEIFPPLKVTVDA
jgi:hypothetical protein